MQLGGSDCLRLLAYRLWLFQVGALRASGYVREYVYTVRRRAVHASRWRHLVVRVVCFVADVFTFVVYRQLVLSLPSLLNGHVLKRTANRMRTRESIADGEIAVDGRRQGMSVVLLPLFPTALLSVPGVEDDSVGARNRSRGLNWARRPRLAFCTSSVLAAAAAAAAAATATAATAAVGVAAGVVVVAVVAAAAVAAAAVAAAAACRCPSQLHRHGSTWFLLARPSSPRVATSAGVLSFRLALPTSALARSSTSTTSHLPFFAALMESCLFGRPHVAEAAPDRDTHRRQSALSTSALARPSNLITSAPFPHWAIIHAGVLPLWVALVHVCLGAVAPRTHRRLQLAGIGRTPGLWASRPFPWPCLRLPWRARAPPPNRAGGPEPQCTWKSCLFGRPCPSPPWRAATPQPHRSGPPQTPRAWACVHYDRRGSRRPWRPSAPQSHRSARLRRRERWRAPERVGLVHIHLGAHQHDDCMNLALRGRRQHGCASTKVGLVHVARRSSRERDRRGGCAPV